MVSTLADVARAAGVHPGTASKALNPDSRHLVAAVTVQRVREIAAELDYQPNSFARGLRTSRSFTIGLLVPDLTNPLFPPIVRGIEEVLGAAGYSALIVNTDNDAKKEMQLFMTLLSRRCDGFILATAFRQDPVVEAISKRNIPAVLVNRSTESHLLPAVAGDEVAEVRDAIKYLVKLGHRRIAHVASPQNLSPGYIRHRAFLTTIRDLGLEPEECPVVVATGFNEAAGEAASKELVSHSTSRPTAILAGNDQLAIGVMDRLSTTGIKCPEDISVIGFNDIPRMDRINPALTTFALPKHEMGVKAAQILQAWIEGTSIPEPSTIYLPCPLIIRDSTGPAPS
ncbi:MAG: LacI family DNA-binding transcriptional regulator [Actinobacteria bacterium]|nr:LacI family DNA-binding transcriptional regulator [Actinomycetota bacterium]